MAVVLAGRVWTETRFGLQVKHIRIINFSLLCFGRVVDGHLSLGSTQNPTSRSCSRRALGKASG
uniref:Uncharacterized protein n=1 Tax=Lepeophtheirus salmonis TaxID=72036 RepID=A0A0K2T0C7_LEPSM